MPTSGISRKASSITSSNWAKPVPSAALRLTQSFGLHSSFSSSSEGGRKAALPGGAAVHFYLADNCGGRVRVAVLPTRRQAAGGIRLRGFGFFHPAAVAVVAGWGEDTAEVGVKDEATSLPMPLAAPVMKKVVGIFCI